MKLAGDSVCAHTGSERKKFSGTFEACLHVEQIYLHKNGIKAYTHSHTNVAKDHIAGTEEPFVWLFIMGNFSVAKKIKRGSTIIFGVVNELQ